MFRTARLDSFQSRLVLAGLFALFVQKADAAVFSFSQITSNGAPAIASQLTLEVDQTNVAADEVRFKISGSGPLSFNIAEIYWDDSVLGLFDVDAVNDPASIELIAADTSAGVGFQFLNINPSGLPGGNAVGFTESFAADEGNTGGPSNDPGTGIGAGQMAAFALDLAAGKALQDVIDALAVGDLRIGTHIRSIDGGQSEGFVTVAVPEPAALSLVLFGLAAGAAARRRV